jgi:hypothetical protein
MLPLYGGPELNSKQAMQNSEQAAKDGLLGNYRSNENSFKKCNGSPPWTPPTAPAFESGGHDKKLQITLQRTMETHGNGTILQMGSDKMITRHVYDKPFMIIFPDRS